MNNTVKPEGKRIYFKDEQVWSINDDKIVIVKSIDSQNKEMSVYSKEKDGSTVIKTGKFWEFNKLYKENRKQIPLWFTKYRTTAKVPSVNSDEDAGYDVFLDFPKDHTHFYKGKVYNSWNEDGELFVRLERFTTNILPTGVGVKVPKGYYTSWANERGSTGSLGMLLLSGIVDSGYRGEVFLNIVPLVTDVIISSAFNDVEIFKDKIHLPYDKAVAQMIPHHRLKVTQYEKELDDFLEEKTLRGDKKLGSTDKK